MAKSGTTKTKPSETATKAARAAGNAPAGKTPRKPAANKESGKTSPKPTVPGKAKGAVAASTAKPKPAAATAKTPEAAPHAGAKARTAAMVAKKRLAKLKRVYDMRKRGKTYVDISATLGISYQQARLAYSAAERTASISAPAA